MLIDEIKKLNMQAMKERNAHKKDAYSNIISKYQLLVTANKNPNDEDVLKIIQKINKELHEELEMYQKANKEEFVSKLNIQIEAIEALLPKLMSEEEIRKEITSLEDKSIKSVMKHFKDNFTDKVDMSLVSKISKEFN